MDWKNRRHVFVFAINLGLLFAAGTTLALGYEQLFIWIILGLLASIAIMLLAYWLPNYLRARKEYGEPTPPLRLTFDLDDEQLGTILAQMDQVESVSGSALFGKPRESVLYESVIENADGKWHYWIETCEGRMVAFTCDFESCKSEFLNYGFGKGEGRLLNCD